MNELANKLFAGWDATSLFSITGIVAVCILGYIVFRWAKEYKKADEKEKKKIYITAVIVVLLTVAIFPIVNALKLPDKLWGEEYGKLVPRDVIEQQNREAFREYLEGEGITK